jgi:hypothetical protein
LGYTRGNRIDGSFVFSLSFVALAGSASAINWTDADGGDESSCAPGNRGPAGYNTADLNCDGKVRLDDFSILADKWLLPIP